MAERARVPVALLLNEAQTLDQALRGVECGFNAVMLDTSAWAWDDAVTQVGELTRAAHARGVAVEGELGRLPDFIGGDVDDSQASLTDPEQAAVFVAQTGVDCLAVSIGNVHLLTTRYAPVDLEHLEASLTPRLDAAGDTRRDELSTGCRATRHRRRSGQVQRGHRPEALVLRGNAPEHPGAARNGRRSPDPRLAQIGRRDERGQSANA